MLELTLIHVSKKGLDCIKIGKVWSIRVICIRQIWQSIVTAAHEQLCDKDSLWLEMWCFRNPFM